MAATDCQSHLTEQLDVTHIMLTAAGIAFTLLTAATHMLLPGSLSSPLILGTALTLYLLINTLPFAKNRIFAVFVSMITCSVAAVTIAAGASRMSPDKTIGLSIQFAIPLILSSLICLSGIDLAIFTFQTIMNTLQGSSDEDRDDYTDDDHPTTDPSLSATSSTLQTDFHVEVLEPMGQIHSPTQV